MTDQSNALNSRRRRLTPRRAGFYCFLAILPLLGLGAVDSVVFPLLAGVAFVAGWVLIFGGMGIPGRMSQWINRDARTIERYPVSRPGETRDFHYRPFGCFVIGTLVFCATIELALGALVLAIPDFDWRAKVMLASILILLGLWMVIYFTRLPRTYIRTGPDEIHFRGAFFQKTIRWDEVTALESSVITSGGGGVLTSFLRVHTPDTNIRAETKIMEFDELRDLIQRATGLDWK